MDSVMFGRPELMFKVKLKSFGEIRDESMELPLIFFSAFERVALESDYKMHSMGNIIQLYEPGPLPALEPIMHVGFLSHVLCRVSLIPCQCFVGGNEIWIERLRWYYKLVCRTISYTIWQITLQKYLPRSGRRFAELHLKIDSWGFSYRLWIFKICHYFKKICIVCCLGL